MRSGKVEPDLEGASDKKIYHENQLKAESKLTPAFGYKLSAEYLSKIVHNDTLVEITEKGNGKTYGKSDHEAKEVMLGFQNLSLSTKSPPKHILRGVTGYVKKGGITAVIGASGSGKSVLMKFLTGRLPHVSCTGSVMLDGRAIDPHNQKNGFSFTPQEDILIGDITIRETFEIAAGLRCAATKAERSLSSDDVIQGLGLGRVADNVVGTILKRGLSGGEKRRTCIGQELIVKPAVACLDEPTSGLDGTAAFDVIKTIRNYANESGGKFSVILSIHQPDFRILSLFDHILLVGNGGSLYFGTLNEAIIHFSNLGYEVPTGENPTDYFLNVTDSSFSKADIDFRQEYATSNLGRKVAYTLEQSRVIGESVVAYEPEGPTKGKLATGFWRQFSVLVKRDAVLAVRDPTLYYLQLVLHVFYGLMIGAVFFDLDSKLDSTVSYIPGSVIWLVMLNSYVHVFKVYYLVNSNKRYEHERANGSYSVMAYFASEQLVTAISAFLFFPGVTCGYWLIGLPAKTFPFFLLVMFVTANTAEGMLSFICKFTRNSAYAVVAAQAVLVMFTVFAGGVFIPFDNIPSHWEWLSVLGLFTHSSKAIMLHAFQYIDYSCGGKLVEIDGTAICGLVQASFTCDQDTYEVTGNCEVPGIDVISILNGANGDPYASLGYLVLLMLGFRLLILFLYFWPVDTIIQNIKDVFAMHTDKVLLEVEMEVERLRGEVNMLRTHASNMRDVHTDSHLDEDQEANLRELREKSNMQRMSSFRAGVDGISSTSQLLVFNNVTVTIPLKTGPKVLIDHISGHASSGRVLALMGPSGAGKTTLLNALSGRATYAKVEGSVKLGNRTLTPNDLDYVPQFDDLNDCFTMRELLLYHAKLKTKGPKVHRRVAELIHIMGLLPKADIRVTELSGGERKRVSIAIGLVGEAALLYIDEPTTGLDSVAAFSVIKYITKVARETGVITIVTIHQPSGQVFAMLEDLMLLERGRLAYFGPREGAQNHFESLGAICPPHSNPANLFLDLISSPPVLDKWDSQEISWADLYQQSEYAFAEAFPVDTSDGKAGDALDDNRPNTLSRMGTMLNNMVVYYWRNITVYWLRLLELIVVALYIGTIFPRLDTATNEIVNISGSAFFNTWCVLFAVISSAPSFVIERRIALQEVLNGAYTPYMYCLTQFLASIPYTFVTSIIYQAIFHYIVGLNDSFESYVYAVLITVVLLLMMEGIMLMVVEVLKQAMLATTFSMVVLGMLFLFPGFFIKTEDLNDVVQWLSYIIPTRYSLNGYLYAIFHGQNYDVIGGDVGELYSGDEILKQYFAQTNEDKWADLGAVIGYVALFRLGHLALQLYTVHPYTKTTISSPK